MSSTILHRIGLLGKILVLRFSFLIISALTSKDELSVRNQLSKHSRMLYVLSIGFDKLIIRSLTPLDSNDNELNSCAN